MKRFCSRLVIALLGSAPAGPVMAQTATPDFASMLLGNQTLLADPPASCDPNIATLTTFSLQQCDAVAFKSADAAMVRAFEASAKDSDPQRVAKLKTVQRLWLAWRNAECDWQSSRYQGGTMAPVVMGRCLVDVTEARTKDLNNELKP